MTAWLDSSSIELVMPFEPLGRAVIPKADGEKSDERGNGEIGLGDALADAIG